MTIETHNTNPETNKPRRWFRFRLRTLLVMVTLMSVPLGWVGWELDQRRREQKVVEWIREMGGQLYFFNSRYKDDDRSWLKKTEDKWFGERVWLVVLKRTKLSDLSPLAELKNIEQLDLNNTQVSDLSPLAGLNNLDWLNLINTQVSDLSPLAELKSLKEVKLLGTPVSDEQVQTLRLALPNCDIRH